MKARQKIKEQAEREQTMFYNSMTNHEKALTGTPNITVNVTGFLNKTESNHKK